MNNKKKKKKEEEETRGGGGEPFLAFEQRQSFGASKSSSTVKWKLAWRERKFWKVPDTWKEFARHVASPNHEQDQVRQFQIEELQLVEIV